MKTRILLTLAAAVAVGMTPLSAHAKRGADDGAGDDRGGRGNDDPPGDDRGGNDRGNDDNGGGKGGNGNGGGGGSKSELRARLRAISPLDSRFQADAKLKVEKNKSRLTVKFETLLPQSTIGISSRADAEGADLRAVFTRAGVIIAECLLDVDRSDDDRFKPGVEFKADIEERSRGLRSRKGDCDIDPSTDGIQAGVPALAAGDSVTVDASGVPFLTGSLR